MKESESTFPDDAFCFCSTSHKSFSWVFVVVVVVVSYATCDFSPNYIFMFAMNVYPCKHVPFF